MEWLAPAIVFMALSSTIVTGTFVWIWAAFVRRRYVLLWAAAWAASVPYQAITLALLDQPGHPIPWTTAQLLLAANAFLVVAGCHDFVRRRLPVRIGLLLALPFVGWAIVGPWVTDRFFDVTLPNSVLLAASYLWMASLFLRARRERGTRGAQLIALLCALAGVHELDYPLLGNVEWAAPVGYAVASMLAISVALCLVVMILEESRLEVDGERARMRAILDHLPVGVLVTTSEGRLLLANGVARTQLDGAIAEPGSRIAEEDIFRRPDGSPCDPIELPIQQALRAGDAINARELAITGQRGTLVPYLVNAGPVHDEQGERLGAVAVFQSIGELKRMQAEMARSQRLQGLGTLAAGVAHDFNNALAMILGHAEVASERTTDPVIKQQLGVISQVAADSAAIVRRIQDVARTRTSRDEEIYDLASSVREVVDISRPRWRDEAQAQGIVFDVRTDLAHDVLVAGHPAEMREALLNMVLNALDAMPGGGILSLHVGRDGEEAVLVVSDDGAGMSADIRERIFDPFFSTKGVRGTGLGLAVVFGIVQRHEGRIAVESTPGRGTRFELRFKLRARPATGPRRPAAVPAVTGHRLLVVDDEPLVRTFLATMLQKAGHTVLVASDADQALEHLARTPVDVMLTDLGMAGMNGWELAAETRRRHPATRVVLVTGWGDAVTEVQARAHGVERVLGKPFTRVQVLACIDEVTRPLAAAAAR